MNTQFLLSSRKGKFIFGSAIGLLAWVLVLLLYYGKILEIYELKTYDQLCRLKAAGSPAPEEVVLIVVDQGSLTAAQKGGINWPWPRQMYAPILQFCASAGAKAVAFDILFTEPSSYGAEDDQGIFATHPGMNQRLAAAKSAISQNQWPRKSDPARDRRFRELVG